MSRKFLRCLVLVFAVFAIFPSISASQWTAVAKLSNERLSCVYFINEFTGFVGYRLSNAQAIAKTTDGGRTWNSATLPFTDNLGDISDIQMSDAMNGWATCDATRLDSANGLFNRGVFRTTDGGVTWVSRPVVNDATSVLQIGQNVFVTSRRSRPPIPITISNDGGNTWRQETPIHLNDVSFVDPMRGVASRYETGGNPAGNWYRTVDGGNNWIAIPNMDESWSLYGEWGTPNFYAVPEDEPGAQVAISGSPVMKSTDYGVSWQMLSRLNFHSTGHLAASNGILYFQVAYDHRARAAAGIYRSTNLATTWTPVNGPTSDFDTRFSATGCKGGVVYASDIQGNLWKTRNGGDGTIVEPPFTLEFASDTIDISSLICETKTERFNFRNLYCSPDSVISIALDPSPAVASGALTLTQVPTLPKIYQTDEGDFFDINWDPSKIAGGDTTIFVKVRLRYFSTATNTLIDTSVVVRARGQGAAPTAILPNQVALGITSSCLPTDSLFTITNTGCDTLYLDQPTLPAGSGVSLQDANGSPLSFPMMLLPGETDTIYFLLTRTQLGPFNLTLNIPANHQKIAGTFSVAITGTIVTTGPQFSVVFDSLVAIFDSVKLDRGSMTRCDPPQEFYLYVRNPGCTEVALRNVMFEGDGRVFTVTSDGTLPDTLTGTDVQRIRITVTPSVLGQINDRLRIRYKIGDAPSIDLFYPFSVLIGYGTRTLTMLDQPRILDTIEYCATKDTVIRFQNTGCDTLTLTDESLTGADYSVLGTPTLPRKIAPGAFDSIRVRYTPRLPGGALGQVTIATDADTLATRLIDLVAAARATDTVTFRLIPERTIVNDNDTLNFDLYPDTTVRGKGLRSLSVILAYNGDVLTFMSATPKLAGLNILPATELQAGQKARQVVLTLLHSTEITLDSLLSLVALKFRTTLSDSSHATMEMRQLTMNGGDAVFAKCVLGSKSEAATLALQLFCGDSLIKKTLLLNKLVLASSAPRPSPASRSISAAVHIPYVLNVQSTVKLKVYSNGGVLVHENEQTRGIGESELMVPIGKLSSGAYHYILTSEGTQINGEFIVSE